MNKSQTLMNFKFKQFVISIATAFKLEDVVDVVHHCCSISMGWWIVLPFPIVKCTLISQLTAHIPTVKKISTTLYKHTQISC